MMSFRLSPPVTPIRKFRSQQGRHVGQKSAEEASLTTKDNESVWFQRRSTSPLLLKLNSARWWARSGGRPSPSRTKKPAIKHKGPDRKGYHCSINALDYYVEKHNLPEGVPDIDMLSIESPYLEAHYAHESIEYLRSVELRYRVRVAYDVAESFTRKYRPECVNCIMKMQQAFDLSRETLYLSVKIFDRYITRITIEPNTVRLIGATAMRLACKMFESRTPRIDDIVPFLDGRHLRQLWQFDEAELDILAVLKCELLTPLSCTFLERFCQSIEMDDEEKTLAYFILECSLLRMHLLENVESRLAAAALLLALEILGRPTWTETLIYYTGYTRSELLRVTNMMADAVRYAQASDGESYTSIKKQYSRDKFYQVALVDVPQIIE